MKINSINFKQNSFNGEIGIKRSTRNKENEKIKINNSKFNNLEDDYKTFDWYIPKSLIYLKCDIPKDNTKR